MSPRQKLLCVQKSTACAFCLSKFSGFDDGTAGGKILFGVRLICKPQNCLMSFFCARCNGALPASQERNHFLESRKRKEKDCLEQGLPKWILTRWGQTPWAEEAVNLSLNVVTSGQLLPLIYTVRSKLLRKSDSTQQKPLSKRRCPAEYQVIIKFPSPSVCTDFQVSQLETLACFCFLSVRQQSFVNPC